METPVGKTMRRWLFQLSIVGALLSGAGASASVTVRQNVAPGATSWPGTPIVATMSNPTAQATVAEDFSAPATSCGQTFTIPGGSNYLLDTISLYAGGGNGTSVSAPVTLNLYDLGGQTAPNPQNYSVSANLLGGGNGLTINYATQAAGVLQFDFADSDRVVLAAGHLYAFEISGLSGSRPVQWWRNVSDTYTGGAAYRNRSWINGVSARDFAAAVYGTATTAQPPPTQCTINAGVTLQQIDGFGAGVVFLDAGLDPLTDAQMDLLYGTGAGQIGLTLIRVRIAPDNNWSTAEIDGSKAYERGARILATPWTPPPAMKDNNSTIGGSVLPAQYANYATYLNGFATAMAANGAPLAVISVQNEPDANVTYESCYWTAAQFQTFFRANAGSITVPVMMPESESFVHALSDLTLNDPVAAANVGFVGGHLYGVGVTDYPLARTVGKRTWMTEYLVNDQTIGTAIATAQQINDCLTTGNMSAYIWWKLIGNANGLLNAAGVPQPRAYAMAQFSRFIRPGDLRIGITSNTSALSVSAFKDPGASRFAIVAVNNTTLPITQTFNIQGITAATITPWRTSATESLAQQAPVTVTGNAFTYTIPATAMVTFAGTVPPSTRLTALSVRTFSGSGDNVLIPGFIVAGADAATPKPVVLRGVGPGLAQYSVTGFLADPVISIYSGANVIGQNDDWDAVALRPTFVRLGLDNLTPGSRDAAAQVSFPAGGYTVVVGGKNQATGVVLAEVYESDASNARLTALSARATAGTGDQTLIGGFIIGGSGTERVIIRGLGPALASSVSGFLSDPRIDLYSGSTVIQSNDNWVDTPDMRANFASVGLAPLTTGSRDAAMVAQLPPGAYTVQLSGVNGTTGVALIEIYELP
ncbi:MAG TPA: glycoside hydrolase family 30 beta sandwich domain-containing protein [Opitutaceae bacterium]|nr:glycoside hydrolase family 30 beta sandwich domain-containing protein [Opitutaceae bacterium]